MLKEEIHHFRREVPKSTKLARAKNAQVWQWAPAPPISNRTFLVLSLLLEDYVVIYWIFDD